MCCRDSAAQDEGPEGEVLREKALWELLVLFFVEAPRAVGGVTEVGSSDRLASCLDANFRHAQCAEECLKLSDLPKPSQ